MERQREKGRVWHLADHQRPWQFQWRGGSRSQTAGYEGQRKGMETEGLDTPLEMFSGEGEQGSGTEAGERCWIREATLHPLWQPLAHGFLNVNEMKNSGPQPLQPHLPCPAATCGSHTGLCRRRTFPEAQRVLLGSIELRHVVY